MIIVDIQIEMLWKWWLHNYGIWRFAHNKFIQAQDRRPTTPTKDRIDGK